MCNRWEIAFNSKCDLGSLLGFLVDSWRRKIYLFIYYYYIYIYIYIFVVVSLVWKESLFLVKKKNIIFIVHKGIGNWSLINRQCYKEFYGFSPRVLSIRRGNIVWNQGRNNGFFAWKIAQGGRQKSLGFVDNVFFFCKAHKSSRIFKALFDVEKWRKTKTKCIQWKLREKKKESNQEWTVGRKEEETVVM